MAELTGTLANFRTRMRRYLQETTASISFWPDDFLNQLFNSAYRRRCGQLHMAFEGYFTTVALRDIVGGQSYYSWPPGFQRLQKLELVRSDGSTVPVRAFERHEERNNAAGAGGDMYSGNYRPRGSGFVLEPTPNDSVTGGLRLEYVSLPVELTADGDNLHPDFPSLFDELLVLDGATMAFDSEGMMEAAGQGLQRSIIRLRAEWELDWERWIDSRVVRRQQISPFGYHYHDS